MTFERDMTRRLLATEMELHLTVAKHVMDAMQTRGLARDEICVLIEWHREERALADVARRRLVDDAA